MIPQKISIITVCYNAESTLEATIQSVINQKYDNKEFIIIDGKSNDKTVDIIKKYEDNIDFWVSEQDSGIPDALNKGIRRATGEWLYFLSSDDLFFDDKVLERIFIGRNLDDSNIIYGSVWFLLGKRKYDGEFDPQKILKQDICHQAQFFKRSIFEILGYYEEQYKYASDWMFNLKAFLHLDVRWKYIDEVIAIFNDNGRTANNIDKQFTRDKRKILIEKFYPVVSKKIIYESTYSELYLACLERKYVSALIYSIQSLWYIKSFSHLKTLIVFLLNPGKNPLEKRKMK